MQRIFNLTKWTRIPSGSALAFAGDRPRKVLVEVNTPGKCVMSLLQGDRADFLALVEGRDTLEFYVTGPFSLTATGADCYVYTADGDGVTIQAVDPESYTVIRDRRPRNPELEYIVAAMSQNMERRLASQAVEIANVLRRRMGDGQVQHPLAGAARRDDEEDATAEGAEPGSAEPGPEPGVRKARGRSGPR